MNQQSLKLFALLLISLLTAQISNGQKNSDSQNNNTLYQPTWESLGKHQTPEWFRDAKFGIYTHWGPNTVADKDATGDWGTMVWPKDVHEIQPDFCLFFEAIWRPAFIRI